jgi:hypothetical protein
MGLFPKWPPHCRRWVVVPRSGLTTWYMCWKMRTITYPTQGCTLDIQAARKASIEAPNPSKDEMSFNFPLNISIQVSTIIGSQLLSAPDPEQSNSLGQNPVRWVWAKEDVWYRSPVEVVGSRTGEFPDPPPQHAHKVKTLGA